MSDPFDPYHVWLGIAPQGHPPDFYRLLGIRRFESNRDVIASAADRQMAHLRTFQSGDRGAMSQRLLNEVAAARLGLLNSHVKTKYDEQLRAELAQRPRSGELGPPQAGDKISPADHSGESESITKFAIGACPPKKTPATGPVAAPARKSASKGKLHADGRVSRSRRRPRALIIGAVSIIMAILIAITSFVIATSGHPTLGPGLARTGPASLPTPPADDVQNAGELAHIPPGSPEIAEASVATPSAPPVESPIFSTSQGDEQESVPPPLAEPSVGPTPPTAAASSMSSDSPPFEPFDDPAGQPDAPLPEEKPPPAKSWPKKQTPASRRKQERIKSASGGPATAPSNSAKVARKSTQGKTAAARPKFPVPAAEFQKEAERLIQETFHKEVAEAVSAGKKAALARKFLDTAAGFQPGEPSRYVLCIHAGNLAAEAADGELIVKSMDLLSADYVVDGLARKAELFESAGKSPPQAATRESLVKAMLSAGDEAAAVDRLEMARNLLASARVLATKCRSHALNQQVSDLNSRLREQEIRYADVTSALDVLKEKPTDPSACLIVGSYRCFFKGEWETGLPLLALGDDTELSSLSKRSLDRMPDFQQLIDIGDLWWQRGEAARGRERQNQIAWACTWYQRALPAARGLAKTKIAKRLEEAAEPRSPVVTPPVPRPGKK